MSRKGFISIRTVMAHIKRMQDETGIKSVPSASAQNFDSCAGHTDPLELQPQITSALQYWKTQYPIIYHFAVLQISSGARVSEILRLHSNDITPDSRIILRSLKGGSDRVFQMSIDQEWLQRERSMKRYLFRDLSRFVIHRQYVKQGISAYFGKNTKRSTTHLFRHLVALDLKQTGDQTHAIKTGLGQKTDKAADHYKTEIRRENDQ